jgi:ketosteroid isomerase-like protein
MKMSRFAFALCCLLPGFVYAAAGLPEISQLFRQGQNAQALDKVNGYLSGNPSDAQARFLKGLILAEMNRTQDAISTFSDLTDDYPELPEPYNNLAVLYASQGQYERAKASLEKAIRTHPSYATAHENLGDIYAKMASVAYDKALQLDKGNASAQMKLSLVKDIFTPASVEKAKTATAKPGTVKTASMSTETAREPAPAVKPGKVSEPVKPAKAAEPAPAAEPAKPDAAADTAAQAVEAWAAAWSRRDVAAYLAAYAPSFKAPENMSREEWENQRKQRISRAEFIKVELSDIAVSGDAKQATVKFKQRYESNLLKSNTNKILTLEKQAGAWKITTER